MKSYMREALEMFPDKLADEVSTLAAPHLFEDFQNPNDEFFIRSLQSYYTFQNI